MQAASERSYIARLLACHASAHPPICPALTRLPRVVKLVRALRKGWIKREQEPEKPAAYLLWEDDGARLVVKCFCPGLRLHAPGGLVCLCSRRAATCVAAVWCSLPPQ